MENNLTKIVNEIGLEKEKAEYMLSKFNDFFQVAEQWAEKAKSICVTDVSQKDDMKLAREGRLLLKSKRVEIEKVRKELKEQSLREGQAIDGIARTLKAMIEPTEEYLEKQEKFAEIQAELHRAELREARFQQLLPFCSDPGIFNLSDMDEQQFNQLLIGQKAAHDARVEAERKAEEARAQAEREAEAERQRVRDENERLRKEAEERERAIAEERKAAELERNRLAEIARKEAEERERLEKEKRDAEAKQAAEEREKIEAEKKAKRAPDKAKIATFLSSIVEVHAPDVKSPEASAIIDDVVRKIHIVITEASDRAARL